LERQQSRVPSPNINQAVACRLTANGVYKTAGRGVDGLGVPVRGVERPELCISNYALFTLDSRLVSRKNGG